jgi:hypothetical protein
MRAGLVGGGARHGLLHRLGLQVDGEDVRAFTREQDGSGAARCPSRARRIRLR